jgi:HEPN domain-containing protein
VNRNDFKIISDIRIKEAKVLINAGCYHGAYYLAGYAIECALKACIAKKTKRFEFPDKDFANKVWVHNLSELVKAAELSIDFEKDKNTNKVFESNWVVVKDWNESFRYNLNITDKKANDFFRACTERNNGILPWIKKRW